MIIRDILKDRLYFNRDKIVNNAIDETGDYLLTKIKMRYGYEYYFDNANTIYQVNDFIKKYDSKYKTRRKDRDVLVNPNYILNVDENTFIRIKGFSRYYNDNETTNRANNTYNSYNSTTYIYIFGKYAAKYNDELQRLIGANQNNKDDCLELFTVTGASAEMKTDRFNSVLSNLHKRDMSTLFFDKGIKEDIINHIDTFLLNEGLYKERDLLYKTGILLYGEPGTGKTSLATAIATYCNASMIIVDINTFANLDVSILTQCINGDDQRFIVLLEDIDTIFNLDREKNTDKEEAKVVNKLLQFLDSNSSPNNVIFVATTNHYDKLDKALLRDGRFDLKVNVTGINKDRNIAVDMCKSFGCNNAAIDSIMHEFANEEYINQSKLQNLILKSVKKEDKSHEDKDNE